MLFESNFACGLNKSHSKEVPIPVPMLTPTGSTPPCADPESFIRGGPALTCFLLVF